MRKFLFSVAALAIASSPSLAADMIRNSEPAPAPVIAIPAFNWTGGYVGIHGGGTWLHAKETDYEDGSRDSVNFNGGFIGGFAGYNYQFPNNIVLGAEVDFNYNWNSKTIYSEEDKAKVGTDLDGSVRARVGYAFNRALIYVTGGWEATRLYAKDWDLADGEYDKGTKTFNGWTIGGGADYAFTDNLFAQIEYRYTNYSSKTSDGIKLNPSQNVVSAGLGYKF